jgi:hypothetical protein
MRKGTIYSLVIATVAVLLLYGFGFFLISVAPHNSYRLNELESKLIENAILQFRERVENNRFDEIREDLSKGRLDEYWERIRLNDIRNNFREYGKPRSWQFFRCAQPQFDNELDETVYHLDYLTKFDTGEVYESFIFVKRSNNEINLIHSDIHLPEAAEWRISERDEHDRIIRKYPNEIIIPYAYRYIAFRY